MAVGSRIAIGVVGVCLSGVAAVAWVQGQATERRLQHAMQDRRQLELRYGEAVASHDTLTRELAKERQRSFELFDALGKARLQVEEAVGRLANETKRIWQLEGRMATMQQQMDQLQGELALTLEQRGPGAQAAEGAASGGIQLERIIVSQGAPADPEGRILSVHGDWHFVVIDLGWNAVRIGDTISIFREEQLLAKARIERVQEKVCAASLLPEWQAADIRVNDQVKVL